MKRLITISLILAFTSCKNDNPLNIFNGRNKAFDPITTENISSDRASWQKPEAVMKKMGNIQGKTIADIGTGTGYFTYRFAIKGAEVIAVDIDQNMLDLVSLFKENLPQDISDNIITHLAKPDDAVLGDNRVDYVFISNTIAYINDKESYLRNIRPSLKEGGKLVIVDFKNSVEESFIPPVEERIGLEQLVQIIRDAGFNIISEDTELLEYQYMVIAE